MPIQYLFDENVDPAYFNQIRRRNPDIVVLASCGRTNSTFQRYSRPGNSYLV